MEARDFVFQECSKKEASFTAETLARFIDNRFYELNNLKKAEDKLIRSIESCRLDLRRFGCNSAAFFSLNCNEFKEALEKYPDLNNDSDIIYEERTASATLNIGENSYFNNETILKQFERLFQLLRLKEDYKDHDFVCEPFVPIVGQIPDTGAYAKLDKGRNEYELDLNVKHGDICIIMYDPGISLLIRDASFIGDILKKYSKYYIKSRMIRTASSALIGEHNLLVSEGDEHERSRKVLGIVRK
ncbi:unnamed protein product [Didymodactylos carnosus]|uniref:Uncharacterized protein n=1 Tax=Didymodactylos carnosus TaxID=1234261 RepID=A0A8S2DN53_9BILA|nr:unnamed protein product [Didymodactylos carnosus]CAF3781809.1 unnamed protein product [Didymodactylos carnosus]